MKVFRTSQGIIVEDNNAYYKISDITWSDLFRQPDLPVFLRKHVSSETQKPDRQNLLPPVENQEIWAAGVTYMRSRSARMEESKEAGGGDFYDRVYVADRPEIFFKATRHRVSGHGQPVRIRKDSSWNVPEPELALVLNPEAQIIGYTIGNDMSSRDIEGENPLYLPQAKVYDGCCGLGPGILVREEPLDADTQITMNIERDGKSVFTDQTQLSELKRTFADLVGYLFRDNSFPEGCVLLTGTGIIPPDAFTLKKGDTIRITIDPIGTLENYVA